MYATTVDGWRTRRMPVSRGDPGGEDASPRGGVASGLGRTTSVRIDLS